MNSAHQVETVEMSDAELANVSGGLNPQAGLVVGPTAVGSEDVLAQLDAVKNEVLGFAGQCNHVGVSASL
ncbi:hypothetical protein ACM01_45005 [Streptomyces viridochromogenes]|uniref:Type A2 lantipeptide n=1 Tax=Streptomyces viridochromogenes TaxID=1938 RepID=A0A0J7YTG7_STRVR|nr:class IIb bacteriocin, lactobin A/cerein 7B family [Streptomyces viridochromogenes]KMS66799.1 hypothetical protein ACM01_45005 [Streptomyces viridochromogenes]KOG25577.1 hypothetical protein ADK36_05035 [Streptomyces viridochromogenes]KOG26614.1 hypothetical protein ADK35_06645 [Streptomyces viridochromogenes]